MKEILKELFSSELNGEKINFFLKNDIQTPIHQKFHFYRIRKFSQEDYKISKSATTITFPSMCKTSDAWARPAGQITNYGRLNRPQQSTLYLALQVTNAIYETHCEINECFFLLVYKSKKPMRISQIQTNEYNEAFDELENAKLSILHQFLLTEFTRWVEPGREYLYKISNKSTTNSIQFHTLTHSPIHRYGQN